MLVVVTQVSVNVMRHRMLAVANQVVMNGMMLSSPQGGQKRGPALVCYVFSGSEAPREWATRLVGAEASLPLFLFRFLFLWYPVAVCPLLTN